MILQLSVKVSLRVDGRSVWHVHALSSHGITDPQNKSEDGWNGHVCLLQGGIEFWLRSRPL